MSTRRGRSFRPGVLQLEAREVPAVVSSQMVGTVLTVRCDNVDSTVIVSQVAGLVQVKDAMDAKTWNFVPSQVTRVDVYGGAGNDTFTARGSLGIRVRMYGQGGDDTMYGSGVRDVMVGGAGNDHLYGRGGNDYLDGGAGDDWLDGGNGNDIASGGDGNDQLIGGAGTDALSGDAGDDVIVSIDSTASDRVDGGPGADVLWTDKVAGVTDQQTGVDGLDAVNAVTGFANPGADLTLNGDRIPDPTPKTGDVLETFTGRPLFSSQGPGYQDITQGQLGDCWLLAGLGSTALADPNTIRSHVVDFGDGTYGVRLGDNFYRVDNDLPVAHVGGVYLQYTAPGVDNSLWVAIMEKAYTYYRTGADTYASIEGGFSYDVFPAFGMSQHRVIIWGGSSADQISTTIKHLVDDGTAPTVGIDVVGKNVPLIAAHQYILLGYTLDSSTGMVGSVTLRNPWGVDGPGSTAGPLNDSNFADGILTISLSDLLSCQGTLEWGEF